MNDGKLYVLSTCLVCRGKLTICPCCSNGYTYVEAADSVVKRWLHQQPQEVINFITEADKDEKK
jgi:hypothetical protein